MVDVRTDRVITDEQIEDLVRRLDGIEAIVDGIAKDKSFKHLVREHEAMIKKYRTGIGGLEAGVSETARYVKAAEVLAKVLKTVEGIAEDVAKARKGKEKPSRDEAEEEAEDGSDWPRNVVCKAKRQSVDDDIAQKIIEIADTGGRADHGPVMLTDQSRMLHWRFGQTRIFGTYAGGKLKVAGWGRHTGKDNNEYKVTLATGKTTLAKTTKKQPSGKDDDQEKAGTGKAAKKGR
jgi:hypothetical protein